MFRNHLLYRLLIFDVCATAALVWGTAAGFVWPMFETDTSRISFIIVAVFLIGKASLFQRVIKVSRLKNDIKGVSGMPTGKRWDLLSSIKSASFVAKQEHLMDFVEAVAILGLVGTLIGLAMVIQSLDPTADYAAAIEQIKTGGSIAVNTSIVGAIAGLWLNVGRRMLLTATTTMLADAGA